MFPVHRLSSIDYILKGAVFDMLISMLISRIV